MNIGCSILMEHLKQNSSGTGMVLQSPEGFLIVLELDFPMTNNEADMKP